MVRAECDIAYRPEPMEKLPLPAVGLGEVP